MAKPSLRGLTAVLTILLVSILTVACGSRTGDYGYTGGNGGSGGVECKNVGQACAQTTECCDATCDAGFCGGVCTADGQGCDLDADCCNGSCNGGVCGCSLPGASCLSAANCCGDATCVNGQCAPPECQPGGATCELGPDCCSGICADGICSSEECTADGFGCADFSECCSLNCVAGLCGSPGCTHDECAQGLPLDRMCTPCTDEVCNIDAFCCEQGWDGACVGLAQDVCAIPCGNCSPNGVACIDADACCSGVCTNGQCANPCQPDGTACMLPQQCCGGQCTNGLCGPGGDCSHDECEVGTPLNANCTPCVGQICGVDPFCCQQAWDGLCVDEAAEFCGLCGTCAPDGQLCMAPDDCCSGQCNNNVCGPINTCVHDECLTGPPLVPNCSACASQVCAADPFCCQQNWDGLCVNEATQLCGLCGNCAPDGQFCMGPDDCCSGQCNGNVCGPACSPDGQFCMGPGDCCSGQCNGNVCGPGCAPEDSFCNTPQECCGGECNNNICGPGGNCSHDECTVGPALLNTCTPCTAQVCAADGFCCQQSWDSICVGEAEQLCGLDCNACTPDGGFCNDGAECCNGSCQNGICQANCQPDGSLCFDGSQCCSMQCNNFQCGGSCLPDGLPCGDPSDCCSNSCDNGFCGGGPVCPSDGSPCGDCVAQSCCGQLVNCITSPGCIDDVSCFQQCVSGGTPAPFCFFQCVNDPDAISVLTCLGQNCAGACL